MDHSSIKKGNENSVIPPKKKQKHVKKRSKVKIISIFIISLLVVIAFCLSFDIGGVRSNFMLTINNKKIATAANAQVKEDNENVFAKQKEQLDQQKQKLDEREEQLNAKADELDTREDELIKAQQQQDEQTNTVQTQKVEAEQSSRIFENMDAEVAAKILSQYSDNQKIANILSELSDKKSADILGAMSPNKASSLIQLMDQKGAE